MLLSKNNLVSAILGLQPYKKHAIQLLKSKIIFVCFLYVSAIDTRL